MSNTPQEYLIEFDEGVDQAAAIEAFAPAGGRITHRLGARTVVVSVNLQEEKGRDLLPPGSTLIPPPKEGARASATKVSADPILTEAFRLRTSTAFREAKKRRPHDRKEWGEGGLEEPDGPEDESEPGHAVQERKARAAVVPTNERLVNEISC